MDNIIILNGLISILIISVIGVYAWTYKVSNDTNNKLADIYKVINEHHQDSNIHADKKEFVPTDVCVAINTHIQDDLKEIKADVKALLVAGK